MQVTSICWQPVDDKLVPTQDDYNLGQLAECEESTAKVVGILTAQGGNSSAITAVAKATSAERVERRIMNVKCGLAVESVEFSAKLDKLVEDRSCGERNGKGRKAGKRFEELKMV
jgi:hypothetical protein